jgi:hypothetical protein
MLCAKCGADVHPQGRELHNTFHVEMFELVDWAKSVSKLFEGGENAG